MPKQAFAIFLELKPVVPQGHQLLRIAKLLQAQIGVLPPKHTRVRLRLSLNGLTSENSLKRVFLKAKVTFFDQQHKPTLNSQ